MMPDLLPAGNAPWSPKRSSGRLKEKQLLWDQMMDAAAAGPVPGPEALCEIVMEPVTEENVALAEGVLLRVEYDKRMEEIDGQTCQLSIFYATGRKAAYPVKRSHAFEFMKAIREGHNASFECRMGRKVYVKAEAVESMVLTAAEERPENNEE